MEEYLIRYKYSSKFHKSFRILELCNFLFLAAYVFQTIFDNISGKSHHNIFLDLTSFFRKFQKNLHNQPFFTAIFRRLKRYFHTIANLRVTNARKKSILKSKIPFEKLGNKPSNLLYIQKIRFICPIKGSVPPSTKAHT